MVNKKSGPENRFYGNYLIWVTLPDEFDILFFSFKIYKRDRPHQSKHHSFILLYEGKKSLFSPSSLTSDKCL